MRCGTSVKIAVIMVALILDLTSAETNVGYFDPRVIPLGQLPNGNFTAAPSPPAAGWAPDWYVSVFERPAALLAVDYVSIPLMAAPVCVAYNISSPATFDISFTTLAALLVGTVSPAATRLTTLGATTQVYADSLRFIIAPPGTSASSRLLLRALVASGAAGFSSTTAWPSAVTANTAFVAVVADEAAILSALANNRGLIGPVPLAFGVGLPCANIRIVTSKLTLETTAFTPYLVSTTTMNHITVSSAEPVSITVKSGAYPIVGPLVLSVRRAAVCSSGAQAQRFAVRVFTDAGFIASLLPWGFAPILSDDALVATRTLLQATCGDYTTFLAGGSSAISTAVAGWVLEYLSQTGQFIDYRPDGSGSGLTGVIAKTHAIAASDSLFSTAQFASNPNVRFAAALSWAVSVVFNLEGVTSLSIPRCAMVPIFTGSIRYWDDAVIQKYNPATVLPHLPIKLAVRKDSSGTTSVFTQGLMNLDLACNPGRNSSFATSSTWTKAAALFGSGTDALLAAVQTTVGSIGYVAAPSARSQLMAEASIVDETTGATTSTSNNFVVQALSTSTVDPKTQAVVFKLSPSAYPFVGVTYFVVDWQRAGNCSRALAGLTWANWTLTSSTATAIAVASTFIVDPPSLLENALKWILSATCAGAALFPALVAESASSSTTIVIIVAVAVVVAGLVIGGGVALNRPSGRDLSCAPKDMEEPFAMVFTDIESSTAQWALSPVEMGPALDQHHDLMRTLVKKHGGYEVKTIGDSFMVAFKTAKAAVSFGLDVQTSFYEAEWEEVFDMNYRELRGKALDDAQSKAAVKNEVVFRAQLRNGEMYRSLWHGLRVRVGIHFARGEPKLDEVTRAYDYYGTVVNTAARVESVSHGGQTCVTYEVLNAINFDADFPDATVVDLEEVELRGLQEPVHLFQILPTALKDRAFLPLRLDKAPEEDPITTATDPTDATLNDTASYRSSSTNDQRSVTVEMAKYLTRGQPEGRSQLLSYSFDFVNALFSTMRPEERKKQMAALRKAWRVTDDPRMKSWEATMGAEKFLAMTLAGRACSTLAKNVNLRIDDKSSVGSGSAGGKYGARATFARLNSGALRGAFTQSPSAFACDPDADPHCVVDPPLEQFAPAALVSPPQESGSDESP